jgi:hypothetical protein
MSKVSKRWGQLDFPDVVFVIEKLTLDSQFFGDLRSVQGVDLVRGQVVSRVSDCDTVLQLRVILMRQVSDSLVVEALPDGKGSNVSVWTDRYLDRS